MPGQSALGYHVPGEYHFFITFPAADHFLGKSDKSYEDPFSLLGLITGIHEHIHLTQSAVSGYCLSLERAKDKAAAAVQRLLQETGHVSGDPLWKRPSSTPDFVEQDGSARADAIAYSYERDLMQEQLVTPDLTKRLIAIEANGAPNLQRLLGPEAPTLTTLDLLEGQAALATEWHMEDFARQEPSKFDPIVMNEQAGAFRVAVMQPIYGKALRIIVHILTAMGIRTAGSSDSPHMPSGELYPLATFLIDYALHLPPDSLQIRSAFDGDTASLQDIYPPFRFLTLCFLLGSEIVKRRTPDSILNPNEFYRSTDTYLAGLVNRMHSVARGPDTRPVSIRARWPNSFLSMAETTSLWIAHADDVQPDRYPLLDTLRKGALKLRHDPTHDLFLGGDFLRIHRDTGLPIMRDTPKGLTAVPFFGTTEQLSHDELMRRATDAMEEYVAGPDWNRPRSRSPSENPWPFIEQAADRRLDQDGARLWFEGGPVRCPLTVGLGELLPCSPRRLACKKVDRLNSLPSAGCRMRSRLQSCIRTGVAQ